MNNSWDSDWNSESQTKSKVNSKECNENNLKNISPYMSKDLVAAVGFNVETPIVNAIIGNLTGILPTKKSETEMIKCEICDCELSSNVVLSFHINGSRHKKKLKALEIISQLKEAKDKGVQLGDSDNPNAFRCEICSTTVNSAQQLEIHLSGAKHKRKTAKARTLQLEAVELNKNSEPNENTDDNKTPPQTKKKKKDEPTMIPCNICNIFMNSQAQYDQHLLSRKHLCKTTGKQQQRKVQRQGRFIKFPPFKSAGTQFALNNRNTYKNKSNEYNPQIHNRLSPYCNFLKGSSYYNNCRNGDNKSNSFLPLIEFQRRF